jgi:ABC-2 type transport system permease protein
MSTILLVARREIVTLLRRVSFYLGALLVPLVIGAITYGFGFIGAEFGDGDDIGGGPATPAGYVDQAGVIRVVPPDLEPVLQAYADQDAAASALRAGTITSYFVVGSDYLDTGRVVRVSQQTTFTSGGAADTQRFTRLLRLNLTGDAQLAARLDAPLTLRTEVVGGEGTTNEGEETDNGSFALAILLMFAIVNGGGWLIQAVAEEKENRTIELVLTSVRPISLMAGKLLGLGVLSLAQLVVWIALGSALTGGSMGQLAGMGTLPASLWAWVFGYFLLGFLLVGSLMMALGAIGASVRESGQLSSALTLPVIAPIWFASAIMDNPDGVFARILSFIPLTAPVTMMLRLGAGPVAPWQLVVSIVMLALGVGAALWLSARLFRATTLLTGTRPTPRVIWRALRA